MFVGDDIRADIYGGKNFGFQTALAQYGLKQAFVPKYTNIEEATTLFGANANPDYLLKEAKDLLHPPLSTLYSA